MLGHHLPSAGTRSALVSPAAAAFHIPVTQPLHVEGHPARLLHTRLDHHCGQLHSRLTEDQCVQRCTAPEAGSGSTDQQPPTATDSFTRRCTGHRRDTGLHCCTALHWTSLLHCTALHCTALHCSEAAKLNLRCQQLGSQ